VVTRPKTICTDTQKLVSTMVKRAPALHPPAVKV
jgi:hypothetical protein